jgi:FkbM family methyltransferase
MAEIRPLIALAGGSTSVRTVVDVGANDGADSLPLAQEFPGIRFVAVEPTPELAVALQERSADLENYTVVACAIGRSEGDAYFHIRRSSELNSLDRVDEESLRSVGIQPEAYAVRERVTVPMRRLDSLCRELDIHAIDVLHVDAQGSDIDVLVSAGDLLSSVRAGVVEVGRRLNLYANTSSRREAIDFLVVHNFRIVDVAPNDKWNYEQNVVFAHAGDRRGRRLEALVRMGRADLAHLLGIPARRLGTPLRLRLRRARALLRGR